MGRVEEQSQPMPAGDALQRFDITRPAPYVHADDGAGARRNEGLHAGRIEVVRPRVDIAKDRREPLPLQGVGRRNERERRHDDLARQPQRADGDLQGHGAVAQGDAVSHPGQLRQAALEFAYVRPAVGQPAGVQDVVDPRQEAVAVADIGPADVEPFREGGRAGEDGEFVNGLRRHIHRFWGWFGSASGGPGRSGRARDQGSRGA